MFYDNGQQHRQNNVDPNNQFDELIKTNQNPTLSYPFPRTCPALYSSSNGRKHG